MEAEPKEVVEARWREIEKRYPDARERTRRVWAILREAGLRRDRRELPLRGGFVSTFSDGGQEWVFLYDPAEGNAFLSSSLVDWRRLRVRPGGEVRGVTLVEEQQCWLTASWEAAMQVAPAKSDEAATTEECSYEPARQG